MSEMDNLKQQIFEIEDFESVDAGLMEKIEQNEECRILFEELKGISKAVGSIAPSPEKNGESLHSAVMKRVKEGDTAPRYINTHSFKFPFATVACLCVVVAIVLASKSGFVGRKMSDSAAPEFDMNNSGNYMAKLDGEFGGSDAKISNVYDYSYEVADEEITYDDAAEAEVYTETDSAEEEKAEEVEVETLRDDIAAQEKSITESGVYPEAQGAESKKKAEDARGDSSEDGGIEYALTPEVTSILTKAALLCGEKDVISVSDIVKFGTENYISFFDSISEKDNFRELYTLENFMAFCENK